MANLKKTTIVAKLEEQIKNAKSLIFTDYQGLKVPQIQSLKKEIQAEKGEYLVVKNTLLNIVLKKLGYAYPENFNIYEPTAILIATEDEVSPLKKLVEFAKTGLLPKIKYGFLGKDYLDENGVTSLSKVPSKNVLIGRMLSSMNAAPSKLVYVLNGNLTKFVTVLNNYKTKIEKEVKPNVR